MGYLGFGVYLGLFGDLAGLSGVIWGFGVGYQVIFLASLKFLGNDDNNNRFGDQIARAGFLSYFWVFGLISVNLRAF